MIEVNLREAREIAEMCIENRQSVILMGTPGIGKTAILKDIACRKQLGILVFDVPSLDPTDVRGVLIPDKEGRSYFTKSALLPDVARDGSAGLLIFDELTSGLPMVQVALHATMNPEDRRLGSDRLPDKWIPAATGNYASDSAGAHMLLSALSDRILMLNVVSDFPIWKEDYALPNGLHPVVIGFLNFRPDLFDTFAQRNKGERGKSFASARTHTMVSKILSYADRNPMGKRPLMAAIAGYVGDGVASEYMAFKEIHDALPDVAEIIDGGKDIVPEEPSVLYALCATIPFYLKQSALGIQEAVDRMLVFSTKMDAEFGGLLIRDAAAMHRKEMLRSRHWTSTAQRYF